MRELPPTAGLPLQWRDFWPLGEGRDSFETALAKFIGTASVQIECSGTACLVIALEMLKRISQRKDVIIPAYTCPLVPMAVQKAGLNVKVCDTQADNFDFDPDELERLCNKDTLAVVPTHLAGLVTDMTTACQISRAQGAWIIEDAAHALGGTFEGRPVGTIGDIGFFSFASGKGLTLYEGGAMVARDPAVQEALRSTARDLISWRLDWELLRLAQLAGYCMFYNPLGLTLTYGFNLRHWLKRGDPVNAASENFTQIPLHKVSAWRKRIGASALARLPAQLKSNVERGRRRAEQLSHVSGLKVLSESPATCGTWPAIMVSMESRQSCNRALLKLWTSGLGVSKLFVHDLSSYPYLRGFLGDLQTPKARALAQRTLTVSNSAWVSEEDFGTIKQTLADVLGTREKVARV